MHAAHAGLMQHMFFLFLQHTHTGTTCSASVRTRSICKVTEQAMHGIEWYGMRLQAKVCTVLMCNVLVLKRLRTVLHGNQAQALYQRYLGTMTWYCRARAGQGVVSKGRARMKLTCTWNVYGRCILSRLYCSC